MSKLSKNASSGIEGESDAIYPPVDLLHQLTLTEVTLDVLRPQTSTNRLTFPQIDICYIFNVG